MWWRLGSVEVDVNGAALSGVQWSGDGPVEFSVCTYNVQARPWFDDSKHKFTYISPLLNSYDICGIQECFKDHNRLWARADHPVKVYHSQLRHPLKIVGSGLSLLGKFPLLETRAIHYANDGEFQNRPASKGSVMARFDVHGMMLDVYTTHIAAGSSPPSLQARIDQAGELVAFIQAESPPENSVILMGDFNMRPSRGPEDKEKNKDNPKVFAFDQMRDQLAFHDASDEVNGPTRDDIDRVLYRPGTGCALDALAWQKDDPAFYDPAGAPLSDHKPVVVRFRLRKA
jgi:endonuclease/exonuclease/phosphatase family metal-dependent hydrolase